MDSNSSPIADTLTVAELVACSLPPADAEKLAREVNTLANQPPEQCWPTIFGKLLRPDLPAPVYACVHSFIFRHWPSARGPRPAWLPTDELRSTTNIGRLLSELRLGSYRELHEWSIGQRAQFWDMMIGRLGIKFGTAYCEVLDPQSPPEHPRWFSSAKLNIADSCFQAPSDAVAVRFRGAADAMSEWTYGQLEELTDRVVGGLQQMGLAPGDPVAIDMPMTAESVAIYLGIIRAGCIVVAIADSFAPAEIATRLRIGGAKAIFTQDEIERGGKRLPLYARVCEADAPRAIVVPCAGAVCLPLRAGDLGWPDFLSTAPRATSVVRSPHDLTGYLFSSGTTGEPKAIIWDHVSPIRCVVDGFVHQDIRPGDVVCWPTNLGWMMGPWVVFASLVNRATIALLHDSPMGRPFGQFVEDARVTMLGVVPSLVATWRSTGCMTGLDWSAIRSMSSTGECSNAQDMLWLMARAGYKPVIEYCGGTELGGGYVTGTLVEPQVPAAFSTPAIGTELVILDEAGTQADSGELFLVPPTIGMSSALVSGDHDNIYYRDTPPGPNGQRLRRHGDHLERLAGGYYSVHGRLDDTMNLGGIKVSSAEIERVLNRAPGVRESAAIAVPPPGGGPSRLIVFVVPDSTDDASGLHRQLQSTIRSDLNPLFHIHEVVLVASLPRTASNKIMRRQLRAQYVTA